MEEVLNQSSDLSSAPAHSEQASTYQEKMLRQSEVNEIVGRAKQEAAAKAVENFKRSLAQESDGRHVSREQHQDVAEERYRRMAAEEAQRLRDQWIQETQQKAEEQAAQRIVKTFYDKIAAGKEKYDDFEQVTGDLELRRFPNIVHMLAENIENSHDVLYELSKNRAKLAQIEITAREYPQEALYDLRRLGESIKKNDEVSTRREANAPLHQQRPSNVGTDSGSVLSMRDLKSKYRA